MVKIVRVDVEGRGYDIRIGDDFRTTLQVAGEGRSALVVADTHTGPLYAQEVQQVLTAGGYVCSYFEIPAGETSKSLAQLGAVLERAVGAGLDRKSLIVALGGGVVGDLAGFAAAVYLRGVSFLQIPTSLLAMVDSAVGGKTGINLPQGKNLVGAFYQPMAVGIHLDTLHSLPEREYRSGLAEVVKYGIIYDADFFAFLEREQAALLRRDRDVLASVVARCCEIKAEVVGKDEREGGLRAILNYGHTLGHAIEAVGGYGALLHGEAIAIGMVYANGVSQAVTGLSQSECVRVETLLTAFGLPVGLPHAFGWEALRDVMSADKKADRRVPTFVLAEALGKVRFGCQVPEEVLATVYARFVG